MTDITLSLKSGRRLAKIKGGQFNDTIIYLLDKRKSKKLLMDKSNDNYISLKEKNEYFQQMPNNEDQNSDVLFCCGRRGSGKTYYLAEYLKQYILSFPKNKIYLFSLCKDDALLNKLITKQIDIDEFTEEGGMKHDDLPDDCCCIFDDIDVCDDGKQKKLLFHLMNSLIQLSRKRNITVIQTSHLGRNHGETKNGLNGASSYTFFYGSISHQIKDTLKIYLGLSQENIKKILNLKDSRYCTIFTTSPPVVMTEKEIIILDNN